LNYKAPQLLEKSS